MTTDPAAPAVRLALQAMATRFELVLPGEDSVRLRAAGEAALAEIESWEETLSLYRPASEIARLNRHAADGPVRVSPPVLHLLQHARRLWQETGGAFDITVAPLVRCWGFMGGTGVMPDPEAVAEARESVGMQWVEWDADHSTVRFTRPGVMVDLGAIGKGYAVDQAGEVLREAGVTCAFLHGGTSSALALGNPPGETAWKTAVNLPAESGLPETPLALLPLKDEAMAVSGIWGRAFRQGDRLYGHVLDPRSGEPVRRAWLSALAGVSATEADALTTAMLVLGEESLPLLQRLHPQARGLLVTPTEEAPGFQCRTWGMDLMGAG